MDFVPFSCHLAPPYLYGKLLWTIQLPGSTFHYEGKCTIQGIKVLSLAQRLFYITRICPLVADVRRTRSTKALQAWFEQFVLVWHHATGKAELFFCLFVFLLTMLHPKPLVLDAPDASGCFWSSCGLIVYSLQSVWSQLEQSDGVGLLVHLATLLRCPQTVAVVLIVDIDEVAVGAVTRWNCGAAFIPQDILHTGHILKAFRVCQTLHDSFFFPPFSSLYSSFFTRLSWNTESFMLGFYVKRDSFRYTSLGAKPDFAQKQHL